VARPAALAPPRAPKVVATPSPPSPLAVVRAYYRTLDRHDYGRAWRRLSPAVRVRFGGFERWRAGYATTLASRPVALAVLPGAPGSARVRHRLDAVDRTPCGDRASRFAVEWRLERADGGWRATSLTAQTLAAAAPC
jgi:hypothetical protein